MKQNHSHGIFNVTRRAGGFLSLAKIALALVLPVFGSAAEESSEKTGVLFIGNSYTAPVVVQFRAMAKAADRPIRIEAVTPGGMTLQKHWEKGDAAKLIKKGGWKVVVLQEQSQIPGFPEEQVKQTTDPAVKEFVALIKSVGAEPLFYCHWPRRDGDRQNVPDDTREKQAARMGSTFQRLGKEYGLTLVPVAEAFETVLTEQPRIGLYAADGSHPSVAGAYLAAYVFYQVIFQDPPLAKPVDGLDESSSQALRKVADELFQP